jgi:precorrin-3B synthase
MTAPYLDDVFTIHLSGCAKGCAQRGRAALTVVGTEAGCALIADGSSRDGAFMIVPEHDLPAAVVDFVRARKPESGHV